MKTEANRVDMPPCIKKLREPVEQSPLYLNGDGRLVGTILGAAYGSVAVPSTRPALYRKT